MHDNNKNTQHVEGSLRLALGGIMSTFAMYGMQDQIPEAVSNIIAEAKRYHQNMLLVESRGKEENSGKKPRT